MKSVILFIFLTYFWVIKLKCVSSRHFANMKPCPEFFSKFTNSVDELLGDWHVALLIMDEVEETFEERSLCIQGKLLKVNSTELIQIWNIEIPQIFHQDRTELYFPTRIIEPGIWLVQSPLGGEFHGTILESDGSSYLLIVYCGWQDNNSVHLMTLAMSRNNVVTPKQKLHFLSLFTKNGYDPFKNKIVSWSDC